MATIVHEATHQIAFNCGLHTRLSDCPLWFSEGIADVSSRRPTCRAAKGWGGIGGVNRVAAGAVPELPAAAAGRLAGNAAVATTSGSATRASASTPTPRPGRLTYFLIQQHPKQYVAYLQTLSAKKPLVWDDAEARLGEFRAGFRRRPRCTRSRVPPLVPASAVRFPLPSGRPIMMQCPP